MSIHEKLNRIQTELKAPKNNMNTFGKYKYRSCEDILQSVKPILKKEGCTLLLDDEICNLGDRYYVKAKAILTDIEDKTYVKTTALAREPIMKKGMDESQITGTASSYARKYALNGMFAIDDTKDADSDEVTKGTQESQKKVSKKEIDNMLSQAEECGFTPEQLTRAAKKPIENLTSIEAAHLMARMKAAIKKEEK